MQRVEISGPRNDNTSEETKLSRVLARSGIAYNICRLGSDGMSKALVGLTFQFDVVDCRTMHIGYDFRLSERPQVLIGPDGYKCTCGVFLNRPSVSCQHIFVSTVPPRVCWQGEEKRRTDFFPMIVASRSTPWLSHGPTPYHCGSLVEQWIYSRVLTH